MKNEIKYDPKQGYPANRDINYQCLGCSDIIASIPVHSMSCKCGNIDLDVDAGRIIIEDHSLFGIYTIKGDE